MRRDIEVLRFDLLRKVADDESTIVAQGCQFSDGTVVMRWLGETPSTTVYESWDRVVRIHHIGDQSHRPWTWVQWHDGCCFSCGSKSFFGGGNGSQCTACSSTWDGVPNRVPTHGVGSWRGIELPKETP